MKKKETNIIEKLIRNFPKRLYWLLAFMITLIVYTLTFSVNGMLSNGLGTNIRSDLVHQMIPFARYLMRVIRGEHSFWFSWANSLGQGMAGTYAYYSLSPFNLIFLIFREGNILRAVSIIIIVKAATGSALMQIFLKELNRRNSFSTVIFAVLYSLCGYQVSYYFLLNFTDSIYLLPVIMLGILRLFRKRKIDLLAIAYTMTFLINFYFGYMLGMCSFIILLLMLLYYRSSIEARKLASIWGKYVIAVSASIMISAVIWLPAVYQMLRTREDDSELMGLFGTNPLLIFSNLFVGQMETLNGYTPFVYCGVVSVVLAILYFGNTRIYKKERMYFAAVIIIFTFIMCIEPLNHIMHVFDNTQMFGYRYSYIMSFLLCTIASKQWNYIRLVDAKKIYITGISIIAIFTAIKFVNLNELGVTIWRDLLINSFVILGWILVLYILKQHRIDLLSITLMILMLIGIEEVLNISICMKNMEHSAYSQDLYEAYDKVDYNSLVVDKAFNDDSKFKRVLSMGKRQYNYPMAKDLPGISFFNSVDNERLQNALGALGFRRLMHTIEGYGSTPVTQALLDVKYVTNIDVEKINNSYVNLADMYNENPDLIYANNEIGNGRLPIYKNDKCLSLGYMVSRDIRQFEFEKSPFDSQNKLLSCMLGENIEVFDRIQPRLNIENGEAYVYHKGENPEIDSKLDYTDCNEFFVIKHKNNDTSKRAIFDFSTRNDGKPVYFEFMQTRDDSTNTFMFSHDDTEAKYWGNTIQVFTNKCIFPMGLNNNNEYQMTVVLPEDVYSDYYEDLYVVEFDENQFDRVYDRLGKRQLDINDFEDGYVKGTIDAGDGGIMFTSIPFDPGWRANIDGKEVQVEELLDGAFVGIELESGVHEVELKYTASGMWQGMIISIIGIVLIGAFEFRERRVD